MQMYRQNTPTIGALIDEAKFPLGIESISIGDSVSEMQETIIEYYRRNPKFAISSYDFAVDDVIVESTDSLLGRPFDDDPEIESVTLTTYSFSDYSDEIVGKLGVDLEESWNGDLSFVVYNDGHAIVGKTDYYSFESISRLLQYEALYAASISDGPNNVRTKDFPIRNRLLRDAEDFTYPSRPLTASSGGAVIANTENGWRLILGRRTNKVDINPGMVSIFPNGGVEYADLWGGGFTASARREFREEFYDDRTEAANEFLRDYVSTEQVTCGWNLRDGGMIFGQLFVIPSTEGYDKFCESRNLNQYELDGLVELDLFDVSEVTRYLDPSLMSGAEIGVVCEALDAFDRNPAYPDLPYTIQSRLK